MKNENSLARRIFRIFIIFLVFEVIFSLYRTADEDTRNFVKHVIKRETRLFREIIESISEYFVVSSDLISEQDIIDIQKEQKEAKKNQFSFFKKVIKILTLRLFNTAKLIAKTILYPFRVFMNLVVTVCKTTKVFAKSLYNDFCSKLTHIIVLIIAFVYRIVRYPVSLVLRVFNILEDIKILLDMKFHSIV